MTKKGKKRQKLEVNKHQKNEVDLPQEIKSDLECLEMKNKSDDEHVSATSGDGGPFDECRYAMSNKNISALIGRLMIKMLFEILMCFYEVWIRPVTCDIDKDAS